MNWIKIDIENLPRHEVLAINDKGGILFGYLSDLNSKEGITCYTEDTVLTDVIYYVEEEDVAEDFKDFIKYSTML